MKFKIVNLSLCVLKNYNIKFYGTHTFDSPKVTLHVPFSYPFSNQPMSHVTLVLRYVLRNIYLAFEFHKLHDKWKYYNVLIVHLEYEHIRSLIEKLLELSEDISATSEKMQQACNSIVPKASRTSWHYGQAQHCRYIGSLLKL